MTEPYGEKTPAEVLRVVIKLFNGGGGNGVDVNEVADALSVPRYVAVNHLIELRNAGYIELLRDGADQMCIVTGITASGCAPHRNSI